MARRPAARKIPRPRKGQWPAFFRSLENQQRRALAEGQHRPPPLVTDDDQAQQQTPDQTEDTDRD